MGGDDRTLLHRPALRQDNDPATAIRKCHAHACDSLCGHIFLIHEAGGINDHTEQAVYIVFYS